MDSTDELEIDEGIAGVSSVSLNSEDDVGP